MSTNPLNGRSLPGKIGFGSARSVFSALAVVATIAISMPAAWAKAPTPASITSGSIAALITANDVNFATDAAADVQSLITTFSTASDVTAVVDAALGTIADYAVSTGSTTLTDATLFNGGNKIGAKLIADPSATLAVLQKAIVGISGSKGKSAGAAPFLAQSFVQGLVSTATIPGGAADYPTFAVGILKDVAKNMSVDELVANAIGTKDSAGLVDLGTALLGKYAADAIKITQGLTAVTPVDVSGTTENARASYIALLTTANVKDAALIAQGAVFVDPFHAADFTTSVLNAVFNSSLTKGPKTAASDSITIAKGVGATLGQDAYNLAEVGAAFAGAISGGIVPSKNAATLATDLIGSAVKSKIPASQFTGNAAGGGGGVLDLSVATLSGSTGVTTVDDLASIVDALAASVIDKADLTTPAGLKAAAAAVAAIAGDVAKFTKVETFNNPNAGVETAGASSVGVYLAGAVAKQVAALVTDASEQGAIFTAIGKSVTAATNHSLEADISAAIAGNAQYPTLGAITVQETTVTNL